jgi:hypothetical protein
VPATAQQRFAFYHTLSWILQLKAMDHTEEGKSSTQKEMGESWPPANSSESSCASQSFHTGSNTSQSANLEREFLGMGSWLGTGDATFAPKKTGHPSYSETVLPEVPRKPTADPSSDPESQLSGIDIRFM